MRILLVNPPVFDFAAYDFWLRPYGLLQVAGQLRGQAQMQLFDFMDRRHPFMRENKYCISDAQGKGRFYRRKAKRPDVLASVPRYWHRFGLPKQIFVDFLSQQDPFDVVLIQTMMTYWYPGVQEVIETCRTLQPNAKIVLGGVYATLCPVHAQTLGADFVLTGIELKPLWDYLNVTEPSWQPALWESYERIESAAIKITDGCPFQCTYCSVSKVYGKFKPRPMEYALEEMSLLQKLGVKHVAFYDDALLHNWRDVLGPFLEEVLQRGIKVNFHTPNALNARFVDKEIAELLVRGGMKSFYVGFESASLQWQQLTGAKVVSDELAQAVQYLKQAGANPQLITAYQILGHPHIETQELEASMHFVHSLGIRGMLADFSPIPETQDGELCRTVTGVDLDEPLLHNKTAFPVMLLGFEETNRLKDLQRQLNRDI